MKQSNLKITAILAAVSMTIAGQALGEEGYYLELHGGAVFLEDSDLNSNIGVSDTGEFDTGYLVGGAFGYAWEEGIRAELALDYRNNDIDNRNVSGDVTSLAGMVNAYFQFPIDFPLKPYVGAGVGLAKVSADASAFGFNFINDDDTVFAYQGMAGVTLEINPAVAVGAGYVYFATEDPEMKAAGGVRVDGEYASHNVMLQVRFSTYPTGAF